QRLFLILAVADDLGKRGDPYCEARLRVRGAAQLCMSFPSNPPPHRDSIVMVRDMVYPSIDRDLHGQPGIGGFPGRLERLCLPSGRWPGAARWRRTERSAKGARAPRPMRMRLP